MCIPIRPYPHVYRYMCIYIKSILMSFRYSQRPIYVLPERQEGWLFESELCDGVCSKDEVFQTGTKTDMKRFESEGDVHTLDASKTSSINCRTSSLSPAPACHPLEYIAVATIRHHSHVCFLSLYFPIEVSLCPRIDGATHD